MVVKSLSKKNSARGLTIIERVGILVNARFGAERGQTTLRT
jgi:hypothetical protein